jgi:2'-5' RNA ligase
MIRSFAAIDLPDTARDALLELGEQLRHEAPDRSVRWSRVSGIHLTLKFLGDVSEDDLPGIKAVLGQAAQRQAPFTCTLEGVGCFPNTRSPRVVWVGVREDSGRLLALQRDVEKGLAPLGFKPEKRAYHPHLTLGRTARHVRSADQRRLGEVIAASDVGELAQIRVESFRLMRSDLRPDGAVYTALETFSLSAAQRQD